MQMALRRHRRDLSPTRRDLIQQVVGAEGTPEGYFSGGFICALGLRATLSLFNRRVEQFRRVLDFGCGPARVVRWFTDTENGRKLCGCDINEPAIRWSRENVPGVEFAVTGTHPPLPYPDRFFDLIYGISVLSHLDQDLQDLWLGELYRVTKPGGFVLLTVHGDDKAYNDLPEDEYEEFQQRGFLYKRASEQCSVEGLPDFYQVAYHSLQYIQSYWPKSFSVLGYLEHGPMYRQDLVVLRRKRFPKLGKILRETPLLQVHVPMGCFDSPSPGVVRDGEVTATGWAVLRDVSTLNLDLWIDGVNVGPCITGLPRPDVAEAFPRIESAPQSGFSANVPAKSLSPGPHVLWISERLQAFPITATYLFTN